MNNMLELRGKSNPSDFHYPGKKKKKPSLFFIE